MKSWNINENSEAAINILFDRWVLGYIACYFQIIDTVNPSLAQYTCVFAALHQHIVLFKLSGTQPP